MGFLVFRVKRQVMLRTWVAYSGDLAGAGRKGSRCPEPNIPNRTSLIHHWSSRSKSAGGIALYWVLMETELVINMSRMRGSCLFLNRGILFSKHSWALQTEKHLLSLRKAIDIGKSRHISKARRRRKMKCGRLQRQSFLSFLKGCKEETPPP